jgi:uncharacterized membrane protein YhhN
MKKAGVLSYLVVLLVDVLGLLLHKKGIHWLLKPLLMPLLFVIFVQPFTVVKNSPSYWIFSAIFLSWFGDLFLLWESTNPVFFILGLMSFLPAHVSYIAYFFTLGSRIHLKNAKTSILILIILSYGTWLVLGLWPFLGSLAFPVIVYAATLSVMVITSLLLPKKIERPSRILFGSGALLFLISDSILAHNQFVKVTSLGGASVMLTYGLAQLFIVLGALMVFAEEPHATPTPVQ